MEYRDIFPNMKYKMYLPNLWYKFFIYIFCLIAIAATSTQNKNGIKT